MPWYGDGGGPGMYIRGAMGGSPIIVWGGGPPAAQGRTPGPAPIMPIGGPLGPHCRADQGEGSSGCPMCITGGLE